MAVAHHGELRRPLSSAADVAGATTHPSELARHQGRLIGLNVPLVADPAEREKAMIEKALCEVQGLVSASRCRIFGGRRKCSEPNDRQSRYLRMALGLQRRAAVNLKIERYEHPMNADVLTTRAADGIAVITLGSAKRIYFDPEMGDVSESALARMRSYEGKKITSPSRGFEV